MRAGDHGEREWKSMLEGLKRKAEDRGVFWELNPEDWSGRQPEHLRCTKDPYIPISTDEADVVTDG